MNFLYTLIAAIVPLAHAVCAQKSVFAHVVMGNTAAHTQATWADDIALAQACGIDAFVLNAGYPDSNIPPQFANAFAAAEAAGSTFKLFVAFDYLGGGSPWPATGDYSVVSVLNQYKGSSAYFQYGGAPFASTFEGVDNTADWAPGGAIRSAVGDIYFVPDWTSLGPTSSGIGAQLDNIQGAFSWDMWPAGAVNKTDDVDKTWQAAIGSSKTYMMGVSPWFFHSPPAAWVWRGDDLWADRWAQTLDVNPQFVQIVTWNDFAESHYVGPVHDTSEVASAAQQFVTGYPHDSWRDFIPYYIAKYKGDAFAISRDQMQYWYRTAPAASGSACGVTGNSASQGQTEVDPNTIMEDGVFFSALLMSAAEVHVQIGSGPVEVFQGAEGINHWSIPFNGQTGSPAFSVVRAGTTVASSNNTRAITSGSELSGGCTNYNAWVGSF